MWFEELVGFTEESPEQVRSNIKIMDRVLSSKTNGKTYQPGQLDIPSMRELRQQTGDLISRGQSTKITEIVADVRRLHSDPNNADALFQVASQFNLLEMVSPNVTPEQGVGIYEFDHTQGPACAIACGAGTIYRNYFVPLDDQIGQTSEKQIDCLRDLGSMLGNTDNDLWQMKNGYALPSARGLLEINRILAMGDDKQWDAIKATLRIGLMWNTQVTLAGCEHTVSQAYCSALPVAYSNLPDADWEMFARLTLEASYEATLHAAVLNYEWTGSNTVFLTLLGGGAFGNKTSWIIGSITKALKQFDQAGLRIAFVSYGSHNPALDALIQVD